jgi:hypothetical protein
VLEPIKGLTITWIETVPIGVPLALTNTGMRTGFRLGRELDMD